jgi:hypothetical protein
MRLTKRGWFVVNVLFITGFVSLMSIAGAIEGGWK